MTARKVVQAKQNLPAEKPQPRWLSTYFEEVSLVVKVLSRIMLRQCPQTIFSLLIISNLGLYVKNRKLRFLDKTNFLTYSISCKWNWIMTVRKETKKWQMDVSSAAVLCEVADSLLL